MVLEKLIGILSEQMDIPKEELHAETSLINDLEVDSLDVEEMRMAVEDEFNVEIPDEELENLKTIGDVAEYVQNNM